MREILFRGKTDKGEWVKGDLSQHKTGKKFIKCGSAISSFEVIPETIGQYTGLTDKNGKKIFEGDIAHYVYEPGKNYWNSDQNSIIEWQHTGFYMNGIMGTNKYACSSGWLVSIPCANGNLFEIIGNIHDNPELLGGDTNE